MEWNRRLAGILKVKGSVEFKLSVPNCNNFVSTFCVNLSHFFAINLKRLFLPENMFLVRRIPFFSLNPSLFPNLIVSKNGKENGL